MITVKVTLNARPATDDPQRVVLAIPHGTGELARAARTIYRLVSDGAMWTDGQADTTITMAPRDLIRLADILEGRPQPTEWRRVAEGPHPRWEIGQPGDGSRHRVVTDEVIRTYGRKYVEQLLAGLPPLPEAAWGVHR
jgi:hypothetical protein